MYAVHKPKLIFNQRIFCKLLFIIKNNTQKSLFQLNLLLFVLRFACFIHNSFQH